MCLLGVLSDKTDTRVYFDSNKLHMAAWVKFINRSPRVLIVN